MAGESCDVLWAQHLGECAWGGLHIVPCASRRQLKDSCREDAAGGHSVLCGHEKRFQQMKTSFYRSCIAVPAQRMSVMIRCKKAKICKKVIANRRFDDYYDNFDNTELMATTAMSTGRKVQEMVVEWTCEQCGGASI